MDETIRAAAQALGRAGRWDVAVALLDRRAPADVDVDCGVDSDAALLRADLLADRAFWTATPVPELPAPGGVDGAGGDQQPWQGDWQRARAGYTALLQQRIAGRAVDRAAATDLLAALEGLLAQAPDAASGLAVRFHLGLVLENLLGDAAAATPHWQAAADCSDTDTAASALRHLGGQAADAGDPAAAAELWWRSFRLRAAAGDVPGALAQLALLAPTATLAEAVAAWVDAAGLTVLRGRGLSGS